MAAGWLALWFKYPGMIEMAKAANNSDKKTTSGEPANAMDYSEHEKTYELFLWLSKWTVVGCAALLLAMMIGFYGGGGLVGGSLAFVVMIIIAFFLV